ncbi:MAG: hypothetical protein JOY67_15115 [Hyphomicrobiales bacterium]|nr:hypothetical protein [Hyphomicrobiales bacterium]MBV9114144.1 hypothetical protein [Hyphomicrobiales bacterium]MBV9518126.1 hypothetical protein [Hyphomicrobiales bacterium]
MFPSSIPGFSFFGDWTALLGILPIAIFGIIILRLWLSQARRRQLLQSGISAPARVLRLWDTGASINDNPKIRVELEVLPTDAPAFRAETAFYVSRLGGAFAYQPGMMVKVRYDPRKSNPSVTLDEGAPGKFELPFKRMAISFVVIGALAFAVQHAIRASINQHFSEAFGVITGELKATGAVGNWAATPAVCENYSAFTKPSKSLLLIFAGTSGKGASQVAAALTPDNRPSITVTHSAGETRFDEKSCKVLRIGLSPRSEGDGTQRLDGSIDADCADRQMTLVGHVEVRGCQ